MMPVWSLVKIVGERQRWRQQQQEEEEEKEEAAMRPNKAEIDVALAAAPCRVTQGRSEKLNRPNTPTSQVRLKQSC